MKAFGRSAGGSAALGRLRSGDVDRKGEYSVEGKTGCILDERVVGEPGLRAGGGGGVADMARGEEWFDGSGDRPGEDGRGEF